MLVEFNSDPNLGTATWALSEGGNGKTYSAVLLPARVTWQQAKDYATSVGAQLVSMETQAEREWIFKRFAAFLNMWTLNGYTCGPWVGLSRTTGNWVWESGEPVTDSPWLPGEPNLTGDFACFYGGNGGPAAGLDDTFEGNARRALILEFPAPPCLGDIDGDNIVGGADLGSMLGSWGACTTSPCPADLNNDGIVGGSDLGLLLGQWGACP